MEAKIKKNEKDIFYIGLILFVAGVFLTYMGYGFGTPIVPFSSGESTWAFPFLNWLTIAGIALAVIGYFMGRKKHDEN